MNLTRLGHIALAIALIATAGSCGGSRHGEEPLPEPDVTGRPGPVNIALSVVVAGAVNPGKSSRAVVTEPDDSNYFEAPATKYEKMHSLRVIIASEGGDTIEHNKLFPLKENGETRYDDLIFKVRGGDTKTIILIANEESLPAATRAQFSESRFKAGTTFDTAALAALQAMTLSASATDNILYDNSLTPTAKYLPITEIYTGVEVREPEHPEDDFQSLEPMYITRAAVKFSFRIEPVNGADNIFLDSITFNSIADKEYLFPNNTVYSPGTGLYPGSLPDGGGRFITDYSIPSGTVHNTLAFTPAGTGEATPIPLDTTRVWAPELYFCESKLNGPAPSPDGKPYSLSITLKEIRADGTEETHRLEADFLPNLPILPRNTHVKVNLKINVRDGIVIAVPYTGVWLNPDFGIERD